MVSKKEETAAAAIISDSESDNENLTNASKTERKAKKAMAKMGLLPVPGVKRVTIRRADKSLFAINSPDVYKLADTFVVFGEAKVEDANTIQQRAAEQARREQNGGKQEFEEESADEEEGEEESDVDESGVEAKDIDLVISQTNCSRAKAVEALKANDNDIVNAVMSLSM